MNDGIAMGQTIIASEQAAAVAVESISSTRLDGLKKVCEIEDDVGRNQFIGGVENAFIAVSPGGKKSKTHQNYLTEIRRVSGYLLDQVSKENKPFAVAQKQAMDWLTAHEPGQPNTQKKYPAKLAQFPTRSNAGGRTATTTTTAVTGTPSTTESGAAGLSAAPPVSVGAATATYNQKELVEGIKNAHENDLDAAFIALANRLKRSSNRLYQTWGAQMLDFDGIEQLQPQSQQNTQPELPKAANA